MSGPSRETDPTPQHGGGTPPVSVLLAAAYRADVAGVEAALKAGVSVDAVDTTSGLCALHIAIGTNNLPLARKLVEDWGASFFPDGRGRWPTVIAARSRVSDELGTFIVEAEAKALGLL